MVFYCSINTIDIRGFSGLLSGYPFLYLYMFGKIGFATINKGIKT